MDPQKVVLANQLYRLSAIGMNLAACVFVGLGLGWLCRRYLHWGDWVVIVGIVVGVLAGFVETIYEIQRMTKTAKDKTHGSR